MKALIIFIIYFASGLIANSQDEELTIPGAQFGEKIIPLNSAKPPEILAIKPNFGFNGSKIHIVGNHFHPQPAGNLVFFGEHPAQVEKVNYEMDSVTKEISKMEIIAVVPIEAENCYIKLKVGHNTVISDSKFYIYETYLTTSGYFFVILAFTFVGLITFISLYKVLKKNKDINI